MSSGEGVFPSTAHGPPQNVARLHVHWYSRFRCLDPSPRYVWKLVYMFMLGYEIDFGHMEMVSLISSTK